MRFTFFVILITLCAGGKLMAQPSAGYIPGKNDSIALSKTAKLIADKYLADSAGLKGDNKKYSLDLYRGRYTMLKTMFSNDIFFYSPDAVAYLRSITDEILKANPFLAGLNPHFLFSKEDIPNAYSTGEGTIVFNMGLFTKLQNESQVAFVLCHELSHLFLDHSNIAIAQYVNTVYSDEFQQRLKDLKKQQYERNKELDQMAKTVVFSGRRHGRSHESEADSAGLQLMKNTRFDTKESLSCLALLDSIDKDVYDPQQGLPRLFNNFSYPFKSSWLKQEGAFFGVSVDHREHYKEEDSLKTHPDCAARIIRLKPSQEKISNANAALNPVDPALFHTLQNNFELEEIAYCLKSEQISRCLFLTLQLYDKKPGDIYLISIIGKCFNAMYDHQKEHTLSHIVNLPSPNEDKNYNALLEFIQRLRLPDIAGVNYYFLKQFEQKAAGDKDFSDAFAKATANFNIH